MRSPWPLCHALARRARGSRGGTWPVIGHCAAARPKSSHRALLHRRQRRRLRGGVPMSTFPACRQVGKQRRAATHLVVREDAHAAVRVRHRGRAVACSGRCSRHLASDQASASRMLSGDRREEFMRVRRGQDADALRAFPASAERPRSGCWSRCAIIRCASASVPASATSSGGPGRSAEAYACTARARLQAGRGQRALLQRVDRTGTATEDLLRRALRTAAIHGRKSGHDRADRVTTAIATREDEESLDRAIRAASPSMSARVRSRRRWAIFIEAARRVPRRWTMC